MAEDELEGLRRAYPAWTFWRARHPDDSPGDVMATRRRDLSSAEIEAGLSCTLPMGFYGDLRTQLAEQTAMESELGL